MKEQEGASDYSQRQRHPPLTENMAEKPGTREQGCVIPLSRSSELTT